MPETQALYKQMVSTNLTPIPLVKIQENQPDDLHQAMGQLNQALLNLEEVRGQLHQAMQIVNQLINR
jgi:septation ring formation regulator EzrA